MKKYYSLSCLFLFFLSLTMQGQIVTAGRMNEVFLKTNLSGNAVLTTPWEITYGPDGYLWITDARAYKVYRMDPVTGTKTQILDLSDGGTFTPSSFKRTFTSTQNPWPQGGLAGLAIHPNFMNASNPKNYVYISYVHQYDSASATTNGGYFFKNYVVRFTYNTGTGLLDTPVALCDTLPGSSDHNSQRMIIVPVNGTNFLFYAEGDMGAGQLSSALRVNHAQDLSYYQGKILRFNLETDGDAGTLDQWIPNDNPYNGAKQSAIWCLGIRNNQGFAYDSVRDILYGASHGPYSDDEVNIIQPSRNYGHPIVIGYSADENYAGSSAGAYPASSSSLAAITSEVANASAIGSSYKDPLYAGYPTTQSNIHTIWTTNPSNSGWPSEAWSGLGLYNYSLIPGWKNSLLMAGLKWGRLIRTKLDNTGTAIVQTNGGDTVINFYGTPRLRDMAFGPTGQDIYITTDNADASAAPSGTKNSLLPSCFGCVQKYTFLGYASSAGTSTIPNTITIASGIANSCTVGNTININATNDTFWVPITDTNSNVIAEINANGNLLGNVTTTMYYNSGTVREKAGSRGLYLDRNMTITPQTQPSTPVKIRLYLSAAEFTALKNATNSIGQPSGVTSVTNLAIFKNSDPCSSNIQSTALQVTTTNQAAFGAGGYVLQGSISGFSSFYIANTTALLPVNLLSFTGSLVNNTGRLQWVTEDENGTRYFAVEQSINGRDFATIGTIAADGSSGKTNYAYNDSSVNKLSSSTVYYRLKMTDADGKFSYSDIVLLNLNRTKNIINVHPNPVVNIATIDVNASVGEKANWELTDVTGKTLLLQPIVLVKGDNTFNVNLQELPAGMYYLKVTGNNINQSVKLEKL